ncbi:High-affinity branched-chain amino acid transport system permease protein LivH [compost metagenome]
MKAFKNPLLAYTALIAVGLIFNFGFNAYIQLTALFIMVNCLMSMSLNLVNGYTGQFSLGHAGFMAIGAYVSAYTSTQLKIFPDSLMILNFFVAVITAGLFAAFAGFLVGQPSLRLKGDYLAIVTLGFGEIIRVALLNMDFVGGPRGFSGIPGLGSFLKSFSFASFWVILCFFTIWRLMQSSHGRGFLSVREDEIAAEAMGINTTKMKVRAFVLSSFFAGVAGALYAHFTNFINPSSFTFLQSVNAVIMVVLGGMGSMTGSIIAAIIITVLPEVLRPLQEVTGVDLRMVIYSLSLILVMILRPKGLFGNQEITDLWRKYVRRSS